MQLPGSNPRAAGAPRLGGLTARRYTQPNQRRMLVEIREYPAVPNYPQVRICVYSQAYDGPSGPAETMYSEQWLDTMPAGQNADTIAQVVAANAGYLIGNPVHDLDVWDPKPGNARSRQRDQIDEAPPGMSAQITVHGLIPDSAAARAAEKAARDMASSGAPIWVREQAAQTAYTAITGDPCPQHYP
jgi:hypothetical protein